MTRARFEAWAITVLGDNPTWKESGDCELAWQAWLAAPEQAKSADCDGGTCGLGGYCDECPKAKMDVKLPKPVAFDTVRKLDYYTGDQLQQAVAIGTHALNAERMRQEQRITDLEAALRQAVDALEYMNITADHKVDNRIPDAAITNCKELFK